MNRKIQIALVAFTSLGVMPIAYPTTALATTVDDQRREVERVVDQLDNLSEQADILVEDYNEALAEKQQLDGDIEKAKASIAAKEGELGELKAALEQIAVQSYTGADSDVMGPLFSDATAYSDKLRSDEYRSAALDVGVVTNDDLDKALSDLNDEQADLDSKLNRQTELIDTITTRKAETDKLVAEYTQKRKDAEAKLGQLIAEEEQRRAEAAWAAAQAAAAQAAAQSQAANNNNNGGGGGGGGGAVSSGGSSSNGGSQSSGSSSSGSSSKSSGSSSSGSSSKSSGSSSSGSSSSGSSSKSSGSSSSGSSSKSSGGGGGGGGGGSAPSPSGLAGAAIAAARSQLGVPYKFGAASPNVGMDCSGLTSYAWRSAGVSIPRTSRAQAAALPRVSPGSAQPGDLIFYYSPVSHVGIYIGGGQMIHAPYTGTVVKVAGVSWGKVTAVGRPG